MSIVTGIFKSSLGRKFIMAGTGVILFLFVVGHLLGNLQVFGPPDLINGYAHFLHSEPLLLWMVRLFMLTCVVLHIVSAIQLSIMNKQARPQGYAVPTTNYGSSFYSRHMLLSGMVVLAFIVYHIAHFTALAPGINGVGDFARLETVLPSGVRSHDAYAMMILGFQVGWVSLFYIIAQGLLFMHLRHGLSGMFQSLGWRNHAWAGTIQRFAQVVSIAILVGYTIIPVSIYLRIIGADYAEKKRIELQTAPPKVEEVGREVGK